MASMLTQGRNTAQNPKENWDRATIQQRVALQMANRLGGDAAASVRNSFICHPERDLFWEVKDKRDLGQTPLSKILGTGGGRGGGNRLRLLLTLLWVAKSPPFDVREREVYAWIIGLDPRIRDDRRTVDRNIDWLIEKGFLRKAMKSDGTTNPILMEESLRGTDYTQPPREEGWEEENEGEAKYHFYFRLPSHFFTSRLISELSAVEIACLLVFLHSYRHKKWDIKPGEGIVPIEWSELEWKARYSLSNDTRQKGFGGHNGVGGLIPPGNNVLGRTQGRTMPSLTNPLGTRPAYFLIDQKLDIGREPGAE